jgi:uncharacterized membrane protein
MGAHTLPTAASGQNGFLPPVRVVVAGNQKGRAPARLRVVSGVVLATVDMPQQPAKAERRSPPGSLPKSVPKPSRVAVIDWLRGLAVVLMIQAHGFDAWLTPAAKTGPAYDVIRHMSGLPSRMFLFLSGVAMAMRFESQIRKGVDDRTIRRQVAGRGLQIIGLAYLFRLQELTLAGFKGGLQALWRVDILNAIGASLLVVASVAAPRKGRPQLLVAVLGAAFFLGLGPIIGPAHFPEWLPRPVTSYIGGQRPMAWFTLFPWAAWALLGVAVGHVWLRYSGSANAQARCFLITGLIGLATTGTVILVRKIDPYVIRYPSELVQQMGPGSFFYRLGMIGVLSTIGWAVTRFSGARFSPLQQLGQTSLLVYWIHVDLCYGGIARPLRGQLDVAQATIWVFLLIIAMLGVSIAKTRIGQRTAMSC